MPKCHLIERPDPLAKEIRKRLNGSPEPLEAWRRFANGEFHVRVRDVGRSAFVIGESAPPHERLAQTGLLVDTLRRNGAKKITLVLPYLAYARQDRVTESGGSLGSAWMLGQLKAAGAARIVTLDIHNERVAEESPVPIVSVDLHAVMAERMEKMLGREDITVVAPDRGAGRRAEHFAAALGERAPVAYVKKKRDRSGKARAFGLIGRTSGRTAVIIDDMVDSGGTIVEAVRALKKNGFVRFFLCATHPILSGRAVRVLHELRFARILFSDSLPVSPETKRLLPLEIVRAAETLTRAVETL
jgi:ribose-phosphate pyrophosphokinase